MSFLPRIAIVGGGPSGLALGLLLGKRGIQSTIYELRSKPTAEELAKPSGMLDLHQESGLEVMRECGLWGGFQAALGDCSESSRVYNPQGTLLHSDEGELSTRPEIARNALTSLFLNSVAPGSVKWNHKLTGVTHSLNRTTGATEIVLEFGDSPAAICDYVIGADGAWSRVSTLLTDVKPSYVGEQFIVATVRNVSTRFPHLLGLQGSGSMSALGHFKGIMGQRGPQDSIRVYAAITTPHEHWAKAVGLEGKSATEVKTRLLSDEAFFVDWAPALKDLLAIAFDEEIKDTPNSPADILPLYMLPIGHRWEPRTGVTLIGDAAHVMTPWAGEGVNMALWDALDAAIALSGVPPVNDAVEWQSALEPRIHAHEKVMLARAKEKAEETNRNRTMFMSENGGEQMASFFKAAFAMCGGGTAGVETN